MEIQQRTFNFSRRYFQEYVPIGGAWGSADYIIVLSADGRWMGVLNTKLYPRSTWNKREDGNWDVWRVLFTWIWLA